jgi:predicted kinase
MRAVLFIGIQASGKSSFFHKEMEGLGYIHISMDLLKNRNKEEALIHECLSSGRSFVIDNTNPTRGERERYFKMLSGYECPVDGYFFQSIVRDCVQRNAHREVPVPSKAIAATSNKLELPSYDEGFEKLYFVKIDGDGGFIVDEWRTER